MVPSYLSDLLAYRTLYDLLAMATMLNHPRRHEIMAIYPSQYVPLEDEIRCLFQYAEVRLLTFFLNTDPFKKFVSECL